MSKPEGIYNELARDLESQKAQLNPERPLLEKIGRAVTMAGLVGIAAGFAVAGSPIPISILSPENFSFYEVTNTGFTLAKYSAYFALGGLGIFSLGKAYSFILGVLEDTDKIVHH